MSLQIFIEYCSQKPAAEQTKIGHSIYFKIKDKVFAILDDQLDLEKLTVKCDMQEAVSLRLEYSYIHPGFHINKEHWNTIFIKDMTDLALVRDWIDNSYELVKATLSKKQLAALGLS
ncbi:Predicted DNA-binding protein, MmcQ/YjbR family [Flexibacter flexilis DSM 6793]|uniref:Predicted DNA-binding protein, MmcQ/YjbR family n=1 Tax=Flexibacter flexilis DSM 6793 TaxID=927664 RepID=A0A1I1DSA0_9BACT|nr:MmcQ/YjbR family DNA-binding protein [Flexibacter flexilis]SFB77771.1 Predicted DNA-binding protein, MmcQ/YjbR family [Flexibacter flexilis DSM 6793]